MEQKIDSLTYVLAMVQHVLLNNDSKAAGNDLNQSLEQRKILAPVVGANEVVIASELGTTIYRNAVESNASV